jgi:hypothetical protein
MKLLLEHRPSYQPAYQFSTLSCITMPLVPSPQLAYIHHSQSVPYFPMILTMRVSSGLDSELTKEEALQPEHQKDRMSPHPS